MHLIGPRSPLQVVNQQAFANNHGIPLAAVVDFVPPRLLQLPQVSRAPVRCKACSAYLNAYCQVGACRHHACEHTQHFAWFPACRSA